MKNKILLYIVTNPFAFLNIFDVDQRTEDSLTISIVSLCRFTLYIPCPEGYAEPKSYCSFHINERINRVSCKL